MDRTGGAHKIVLMAPGTLGDVLPFVGIGATLKRRGYDVELLANPVFAGLAESMELAFAPVGTEASYRRGLNNRDLSSFRKGLSVVIDSLTPDHLEAYRVLSSSVVPGRTLVIAHPLSMAARLAQETRGIPCVTAVLSTCWFRTLYDVPVLYGKRDLSNMWRPLKALMWRLADRFLIDPAVTPGLNKARRELGLAPIRRPFHEWIFSPLRTVGLFPDWFAPRQPDWSDEIRLSTFPNFHTTRVLPPSVKQFLALHQSPLVFTAGSVVVDAPHFIEVAREVCGRLDKPGVVIGLGDEIQDDTGRGEWPLLGVPFAPLDRLLGSACAIVHHGGVGTTAAALAAGIPQVVRPVAFDQPDHAARVEALDVGGRLLPPSFDAPSLTAMLIEQMACPKAAGRRAILSKRLRKQQPLDLICDALLEGIVKPPVVDAFPCGR